MRKFLFLMIMMTALASQAHAVSADDYAMKFTVTIAAGVGDKTAANAVVPIRLSESVINGFQYSDFNETDGTDLFIVDGAGTPLDYEIDMWNPDGETTVWVKVPQIAAGTVLTVYYKGAKNTDNVPNNVWSLFLGVWHFNETSVNGTVTNVYEATGKTELTGFDTPRTTSVDGLFGLARQPRGSNYANNGVGGVFLPAMTLNGKFAISGWFNIANCGYPTFFSTKENFSDSGFHYFIGSDWSMNNIELTGNEHTTGWNSAATGGKVLTGSWNRYCFVHDDDTAGANFWLYIDGVKTGTGNKGHGTVTDNGKEICIGNVSCAASKEDNGPACSMKGGGTGAGRSFCGQMDEIRIQSYANFDADREYFEGSIAKDATLSVYSPAASCSSLVVDLSFEVVDRVAPAEIVFSATVEGANGVCTYSWDFDNDGFTDRVGTSATETWECVNPGQYHAKVSVMDSDGVSGECTTLGTYVVNGVFYADGDETQDGNGTAGSPFNNLRSLAQKMNDGDSALLRGTFTVGNEAEAIVFGVGNIAIDRWGDENPLIQSETTEFKATNGILVFNGANVAVSNLVFAMTPESFSRANIVRFNGNNVTVGHCDFSAIGGRVPSVWGYAGGLGAGSSQNGLRIEDCSFSGFRDGDKNVFPVIVNENATVARCVFQNVSTAIRANNGTGGGFNFISNVVLNAESESLTGDSAGVVIKGGWSFFSGSTIAYNRFINPDPELRAGCVVYCTSKTGQHGISVHHNTLVGFRMLASFDGTQDPWTFSFFDNLLVGSDCLFKDTAAEATYVTQETGFIRNNAYSGQLCDVPEGYAYDEERMTIDGNFERTEPLDYIRLSDPSSPDFYRPRISEKRDPLMVGGWTNDGTYPAYIGALEPIFRLGLLILFH